MSSTLPASPLPYVFPERALRRWSRENLHIETGTDGSVAARFRFEGSTCGNVPFQLDYHLRLDSSAQRIITGHRCHPVPFDEGHQRMCCWQEDADQATRLFEEAPLLGQPLDAVLVWRPARSPAGCLCAPASRAHKWQAVLETLHFALATVRAPLAPPSPSP